MAKKSCKKGYYYCNTDKKCKKIPKGWHVMPSTGYLMRDSEHQDEKETEGKKKNGNGANGNGNGNGGSDGGSNGGGVSESKDHEVAMAQSQLKKSARNIAKLRKALGKKEKDLPAWMQAKITDTAHDTDAAAGYMDEGTLQQKAERYAETLVNKAKGAAAEYDAAKKKAENVKTTSGSVTIPEEVITEKRDGKSAKDKGYSLRDWFKGGGWVQAGGKYDGKPCAKQPGQKTKPFCRDADDRASMSKKERNRRAAKKRREDPNPNRRGRAKMVTASYSNWRAELEQLDEMGLANAIRVGGAVGAAIGGGVLVNKAKEAAERLRNAADKRMGKPPTYQKNSYEPEGDMVDEGKKDACYHKVKSRYKVWPSAYASGALVKCRKVGAKNWGNKTKKENFSNWREDILLEGLEDKLRGMSASQIEDLIKANKGAEEKIRATLAKMRSATPNPQGKGAQLPNVPKRTETYQRGGSDRVSYQRRQTVTRADVQGGTEAAKRAAAGQGRYRPGVGVTPDFKLDPKFRPPGSRGMSGGVRPRGRGGKIGLAVTAAGLAAPFVVGAIKRAFNKEDYDYSNWRDDFQATEVESVDLISNEPLQPTQGLGSDMLGEAKSKDKLKEISKQLAGASKMHAQQSKKVAQVADNLEEAKKCWKGYKKAGTQKLFGKTYNRCVKAHFSDWRAEMDLQEKKAKKDYDGDGKIESGSEEYLGSRDKAIKKAMGKKNCGCGKDPCETYGKQEVKEDWQKSNRKDGVDGMSQKSVNAYRRENPGSKLQTAVTEKKPKGKRAKRRKSFCARSKGQKDMHNIDCTKTPDKKICKARKRWRC